MLTIIPTSASDRPHRATARAPEKQAKHLIFKPTWGTATPNRYTDFKGIRRGWGEGEGRGSFGGENKLTNFPSPLPRTRSSKPISYRRSFGIERDRLSEGARRERNLTAFLRRRRGSGRERGEWREGADFGEGEGEGWNGGGIWR